MAATDTATDPRAEALAWYRYLNQGKVWQPDGKPMLPITEMDAGWRGNAARMLLRRAPNLAVMYGFGQIHHIFGTMAPTVVADRNGQPVPGPEAPIFAPMGEMAQDALDRELEEAQERRDADPEGWLRTTALYQALVAGLPDVDVPDYAAFLSQGKEWRPGGAGAAVPIAGMNPGWRYNSANWLLREIPPRVIPRGSDRERWLKATPLYQALTRDLPDGIAELAKHWSTCDLHTGAACSCWSRHITECPVSRGRDISAPCHCNDNSPEWTN